MNINFKGKTILVVDDDLTSLLLFNELLESTGADIVCAPDGKSAIEALVNRNIDIVLLDIKLTDISGYALLIEFRKINPFIIVIAQTALSVESYQKCIEAGFNDYITKPIMSNELLFKIDKHLIF